MKATNDKNRLDTVFLWKFTAAVFIAFGLTYSIGYIARVIFNSI